MKTITQIETRSKLFEEVISSCQYILENDQIAQPGRDYLDDRIPKSFQKQFKFGFFPPNDSLSFLTSLVDKDVLKELGLVYSKSISGGSYLTGHFNHHNLIFPFYDMYGNIIALVGRTLLNKDQQTELEIQKYKYTFGLNKELYLFGLNDAKKYIIEKNCVILVEGQFDYFSCVCAGINNVVALGGAVLSNYQFYKLRRYTNNFALLLDSDEAGRRASNKINRFFQPYANIKIKNPTNGFKDIDELLNKADKEIRTAVIQNLHSLGE